MWLTCPIRLELPTTMSYQPQPIDTSHVTLDPEHEQTIELLAKNTHELWARQRLSDGWQYGDCRNDDRLEHPGLVPYDQLTEVEKEYDRVTSRGVVKTLLALGYCIEPQTPNSERERGALQERRNAIAEILAIRFGISVPKTLVEDLEQISDRPTLQLLFEKAISLASWEEFQQAAETICAQNRQTKKSH